jgi:hypothetical protein
MSYEEEDTYHMRRRIHRRLVREWEKCVIWMYACASARYAAFRALL